MPEIQSSESQDVRSAFIDSRRLPDTKGFGCKRSEFPSELSPGGIVSERVRHASKLGERSSTVSSPSTRGSRRVNTQNRGPIGADDDRVCARSIHHVSRSRCSGTTSAALAGSSGSHN